ncbi:MAG: hypothetical protein ABMA25_04205 [Ilumatobacteraceae bacterium]
MRNRHLLPVVVLLLAACSSERAATPATSATGTGPGTSVTAPASTTGTDTTVPPTTTGTDTTASTVAPTTPPSPPTTEQCRRLGDTAAKTSADPLAMSSMVGVDIRIGDHPCYERVVIELAGAGDFPGWSTEYVNGPVRLGESDEFVEIGGDATLLVRMGMWMPTMEGDGYSGPTDISPTTVDHIVELRQTENWEGMTIWAIGVDEEYPFTVTMQHAPERLVIDFQVVE